MVKDLIKGGDLIKLTDKQQLLVEHNHNIIYSILNLYHLKYEDWYDIAAIGLCKAAIIYDSNKGKFSTIAYKCIINELKTEFIRIKNRPLEVSLDNYNQLNEDILIAENHAEDLLDYNELSDYIKNNMTERQQIIINYLKEGIIQSEIGRKLKVSRTLIGREVKKIREKIKKYYEV